MITQFIRQYPCCQVTHPFTCASYNPFEVLHLDHIGPLKADDKGYTYILVIIDAFSRWVELFPTTSVCAYETASCLFQHFGRFGTPAAIHNELIAFRIRTLTVPLCVFFASIFFAISHERLSDCETQSRKGGGTETLQYVLCTVICPMYCSSFPFSSCPFRILRTFHHCWPLAGSFCIKIN